MSIIIKVKKYMTLYEYNNKSKTLCTVQCFFFYKKQQQQQQQHVSITTGNKEIDKQIKVNNTTLFALNLTIQYREVLTQSSIKINNLPKLDTKPYVRGLC